MIVMQCPQFTTQDGIGGGDGVAPIPQWFELEDYHHKHMSPPDADPDISDVLGRLHLLFNEPERFNLSTTDLHDLTCFVLHRLLDRSTSSTHRNVLQIPSISDSLRYAIALYLLIIHGPTYFSHAQLQYTMVLQLKYQLENSVSLGLSTNRSVPIWLLSVGMVASDNTPDCQWFTDQSQRATAAYGIYIWDDVLFHLKEVLWLRKPQAEHLFRQKWDCVWANTAT
jgi:hypothetical protein